MSSFEIAYEDEDLLVVDKGPGLVVHPARGHREDTLSQLLAASAEGGDPERAGIVHRLDRDTSGLLVVSRSDEIHALLQAALAKRLIERAGQDPRSGGVHAAAMEAASPMPARRHSPPYAGAALSRSATAAAPRAGGGPAGARRAACTSAAPRRTRRQALATAGARGGRRSRRQALAAAGARGHGERAGNGRAAPG